MVKVESLVLIGRFNRRFVVKIKYFLGREAMLYSLRSHTFENS